MIHETIYSPLRTFAREVSEVVKYRELLKNLVIRDLKVRYRRSVLGFIWMMLNPLLMMVVLSVVFSGMFRVATKNYTVYLLSGIVMWNLFSQSTSVTVRSFLDNSNLIKKLYIPKAVFPLSSVLSAVINFVFSLVPLLLILFLTGERLSPHFYLLPLCVLLVFIFSLGVSLMLSTVTVFFHDVVHIYEVLLLAWMYATPVFYPEAIVPEKFRVILNLNPIYYFLNIFRAGLYQDVPQIGTQIIWAISFSLASLFLGCLVYTKYKDRVIYYL
jgi:ABC-type polysaccharide/polyol phosphate export permease